MITTQQQAKMEKILFKDDGTFPNNALLPLVIYRNALEQSNPALIEKTFKDNNWTNAWRDGLYDYHHYHSTAHEVLGVYRGSALVQFGGAHGVQLELNEGDVVVIPAGVAHKCIQSYNDFKCVGAYPKGQESDINYGKFSERPEKEAQIAKVPLPQCDPVYGINGPLLEVWSGSQAKVTVASKEKAYRNELEHQLEESFRVKNIFTELRNTYIRNFFDKWIAGGIVFAMEVLFYLLFIAAATFTVSILLNDTLLLVSVNDVIASSFAITPEERVMIVMFSKAAMILFSGALLFIALMLRGIRIRNGYIDNLIAEINRDIRSEEEREERIKRIL